VHQEREFIEGLRSDPESALGVLELAISTVLDHFGRAHTKKLIQRALAQARLLKEFDRHRGNHPDAATPQTLARYLLSK
jgi:hypothetical protein